MLADALDVEAPSRLDPETPSCSATASPMSCSCLQVKVIYSIRWLSIRAHRMTS